MKRIAAIALLLVALLGCASTPFTPSTPRAAMLSDDVRTHPENYVVITVRNTPATVNPYAASTTRGYTGLGQYRAGADAIDTARRIASVHRMHQVAAWPIEVLGVHCLVYAIPPATQREQVLATLLRDPDVESAQPLSRFDVRSTIYNDPYVPLQANLVDMDVMAAQQWSRGEGVRLAVIDTGIDTAHPDFAGRLPTVRDFVLDGRPVAEAHGTAVAGIIAAVPNNGIGIAGIAPDATVVSYRACWTSDAGVGVCNTFTLAQALAAAVDTRATIVNLSIGGPHDPLLRRIVERGLARGIVFVGAVPGSGRREGFPTDIGGVIAVDMARRKERAARVLYAPGTDVFTLTPRDHYDVVSGSSVASAEVAAVIALLLSSRPGLNASELEALLSRSTSAAQVAGSAGASVNACAALRDLQPTVTCSDDAAAVAHTR